MPLDPCPPEHQVGPDGECIPGTSTTPPGPDTGPCPAGQVPKTSGQGCKPEGQWWDDSPDELSKRGEETCNESEHPSPKECYWCDFDTRSWKRGWCPPGSGGTGTGIGGTGAPRPNSSFNFPDYGSDIESEINGYLRDIISGKNSRYNPEAMAAAKGQLKSATQGGARSAREQAQWDLIRTGMNRSPAVAGRQYQNISQQANQQYGEGVTRLVIEKATADFNDRMAGLNALSQQLEQSRQWRLSRAMTQLEYMRINNAYEIALRNISMQQATLNQQWAMFGQQMGLSWAQLELERQRVAGGLIS